MNTGNEDIITYFRARLPVMLDGAVQRAGDRGSLLRRARVSLGNSRSAARRAGLLPAEILRETLGAVVAPDSEKPKTLAGAAPVGPHHARVWWDARVLDTLDDVLARLDSPRLILRFYDITGLDPDAGRWHATFDLDVDLVDAGKTVHFWSADRSYAVDLGFVHADGRFLRLARTNIVDLPRAGAGVVPSGETARSRIRPVGDVRAAYVAPDASAEEWDAGRADFAGRDREAELVVHMLYRAFLLEGPRALRRAPALVRRGADVLRGEYLARRRARAGVRVVSHESAFLVRRLDAVSSASVSASVAAVAVVQPAVAPAVALGVAAFAWHQGLLRSARGSVFVRRDVALLPVRRPAHIRVAGADMPAALFAIPVFEAARRLRESLSGLRDIDGGGRAGALSPGGRGRSSLVLREGGGLKKY